MIAANAEFAIEEQIAKKSPSETPDKQIGPISRKALADRINLIHFQERPILCELDYPGRSETLRLSIRPQPTFGVNLVCLWPGDHRDSAISGYRLKRVIIPDRKSVIDITPDIRSVTARGFCIRLPESGTRVPADAAGIRPPEGVSARIGREGLSVMATIDRIRDNFLTLVPGEGAEIDFIRFDYRHPVDIDFFNREKMLFTGRYRILETRMEDRPKIDLEPWDRMAPRFPSRKYRSPRFTLSPSPDANFVHPLHGGHVSMNVLDISGAGFSVEKGADEDAVLVGMIVTDLELNFSGAFIITCSAQVVHRTVTTGDEGEERVTYGFAFIDMSIDDHLKLAGILHQRENSHIRVCNAVDENDLWSFLFETGFVYPRKYHAVRENAARIRAIYRTLYTRSPAIARHFIYREKGEVVGHLSMLHLYRDAWLIHHHAALKRSSVKAGLAVLNHLARFCYNSIWLDACHMRYIVCYFRPENGFPNFFFKGFADRLNDKARCSTDTFAYLTHRKRQDPAPELPVEWTLEPANPDDLARLSDLYRERSGGLAIDALDLSPSFKGEEELEKQYHNAGLKKERRLFSLKQDGTLKAVAAASVTDTAINLSDLSNCLTVFVVDPEGLNRNLWSILVERLGRLFEQKRFPVLLHPLEYADREQITYHKQYILWILATRYSDQYFEFLDQVNTLSSRKR